MSCGSPAWLGWSWVTDQEASAPFFRRALELGINFFDTADSHSDGRSEETTGRRLKEYARRDEVVITIEHFVGRGETREQIQRACEASLRRLGVDVIDLYQIYRLRPGASLETVLSALDDLAAQGKVRHIGSSSMCAWRSMKALGMSDRNGRACCVSVQNLCNLLYREEEREMMPL